MRVKLSNSTPEHIGLLYAMGIDITDRLAELSLDDLVSSYSAAAKSYRASSLMPSRRILATWLQEASAVRAASLDSELPGEDTTTNHPELRELYEQLHGSAEEEDEPTANEPDEPQGSSSA